MARHDTAVVVLLAVAWCGCGEDGSRATFDGQGDAAGDSAEDTAEPGDSVADTTPADTAEPPCTSSCTTVGARRCDGATVNVCREQGECLVWQASSVCGAPLVCSQGQCATSCSDDCSVVGARKCEGDGVVTCGDPDQDGCLGWSAPVACDAGQTCSNGNCALACTDECDVSGAKACETGGVKSCGNYDGDPCLEWGDPVPCEAGATCSNGYCSGTCSDECAASDTQCTAGGVATCGESDGDPCLEWGDPVACDAGLVCVGGACLTSCASECESVGQRACTLGGYHECADPDGDGCLTWSATVSCGPTASCDAGDCESTATPAKVVISEVYYDSPADDAGTYVELHGSPGTDLTGFELVGINGQGGTAYATVALAGTIGGDGLFLVVDDLAGAELAALADQVSSAVNQQNGPDSVQLRWGELVVDAVGYGVFGASDVFAGEGSPAPDAPAGSAIARSDTWADTDDNAADFHVVATLTPGAPNPAPGANLAPTAAITCPSGGDVGQTLSFDASGSHDDGAVVSWSFDFGDGESTGPAASASAQHAFAASGSYLVSVTVSDAAGLTDAASCSVSIDAVVVPGPDGPPTALFTATPSTTTIAVLDATASWDLETARDALLVRWDFEADGSWDTGWGTDRVVTHPYGSAGPHTARLEVKDGAGQVASAELGFTLAAVTYVSGTVTTGTWSGTVVVQGDVTVPAGETLTIQPGTQVLAVYLPQGDQGSVGIRVDGRIDAQGTAQAPILFSVYGDTHRQPSAWQGLDLRGDGASLAHAVVEYAVTGVQTREAANLSLTDTTLRHSVHGVQANTSSTLTLTRTALVDNDYGLAASGQTPANVTFQDGEVARNALGGLQVLDSASLGLDASDVHHNAGPGVSLFGGTVSVIQSRIRANTVGLDTSAASYSTATLNVVGSEIAGNDVGMAIRGRASAVVSYSRIVDSRYDGVIIDTRDSAAPPASSITNSDITGNGTVAASVIVDPGIQVATTYEWDGGAVDSSVFATGGGPIRGFSVGYYEGSYNSAYGAVQTSDGRLLYQASMDEVAHWEYLDDDSVVDLFGRVYDTAVGYRASLVVYAVWYRSAAADNQVAIVNGASPVTLTNNWWGAPSARVAALSAQMYDASSPASGPVAGAGVP